MANSIIDLGTIDVIEPISSDGSRGLTAGEIAMLRPYFGDSMDYSKITINKNWSMFIFEGAAASFGGTMYVDTKDWSGDYSTSDLVTRTWFVHEMSHQWQDQQGYNVFLNGVVLLTQGGSQYDYRLDSLNPISFYNYNIESQADMIAHHYAYTNAQDYEEFRKAIGNADYLYLTQFGNISALMQTVEEFINSSHDATWLPESTFAFEPRACVTIKDAYFYKNGTILVLGVKK